MYKTTNTGLIAPNRQLGEQIKSLYDIQAKQLSMLEEISLRLGKEN
jgi:hypothetical protein